jgi:hypothetical protein
VFAAVAFVAASAFAQSVAVTPRGVVVAHDRFIDVYDPQTLQRVSRSDGVEYAGEIVASTTCDPRPATCDLAVLDPIHNRARVNDTTINTGETPIAGAFVDHQLYILARDGRTLSRGGESLRMAAYPAFLRVSKGMLYVYSPIDGVVQEITTSPFAIARELKVPAFATDFEVDFDSAYLVYPAEGVHVIDLVHMKEEGKLKVGWAPIDLALAGGGTALTARVLAIADPAAKRVWTVEGPQSTAQAFGRGFLRGMFGLGLFSGGKTDLATGVDRVVARGGRWVAFDSSSGTLYNVTKKNVNVLGRGLAPHAFAISGDVVYFWQSGMLVAQKLGG